MAKIEVGDVVTAREFSDIHDRPLRIPDPKRVVHLQFRRFAGCPICNLHMRSISRRHDEIVAAGIREVVVFPSADAMREFQADLPFTTIADQGKELYREFGVEASLKALLNPRAWSAGTRGMKGKGHPSLRDAAGFGEKHLGFARGLPHRFGRSGVGRQVWQPRRRSVVGGRTAGRCRRWLGLRELTLVRILTARPAALRS